MAEAIVGNVKFNDKSLTLRDQEESQLTDFLKSLSLAMDLVILYDIDIRIENGWNT
jgi:hypothetical protein